MNVEMKHAISKQTERGKIPEEYHFYLNPHHNRVFSKCPKCERRTRQKKLPLVIEIPRKKMFLNLNKTCRYCEHCDLLIARKKEMERILSMNFGEKMGEKDYSIVGTTDEEYFKKAMSLSMDEDLSEHLLLFKEVWNFDIRPRWEWVMKR